MKPEILQENTLSPQRLRYWSSLAAKLTGRVDYIDPNRTPLKELRKRLPINSKVYRASTGGRWGKSAEIRTI